MLDNTSRFFLAFSHDTIIIPLIIIGYIWIDRKVFFHGICLLLTSMLLNLALKITFQVPLAPSLGKEGFAFPSRHMQSSIVLYGWLLKSVNKRSIKVVITILLIGISIGLVHLGYHNYFDVLAAVFLGLLLIFIYSWFLKTFKESILSMIVLLFNTLLMAYIVLLYEIKEYVSCSPILCPPSLLLPDVGCPVFPVTGPVDLPYIFISPICSNLDAYA